MKESIQRKIFMTKYLKEYPIHKRWEIEQLIMRLTDDQIRFIYKIVIKRQSTVLWLAIFLGFLGADRFELNDDTSTCVFKSFCSLILVGICWYIIDIFTARYRAREYNYKETINLIHIYLQSQYEDLR
ncbi:MAG: TM2 domain-containing protein [Clostridia bacterium]|nr:TM2 domain-containing protein [Clostridia bacterium]